MDGETQERVIRFLASIAFAGMLMIFAYLVKESLPYVTGALGLVVGQVTGSEIATRTKKQTLRKVQESERPPPPDDDDGSGTTVQALSDAPPPPPRNRRIPPRSYFGIALVALSACAAASNPAPKIYGAERLACVQTHKDSEDAARACMREVDRKYGQDGGL